MLTNPDNSPSQTKGVFRNPLLYSSVVLAVALLAVAWVMFSRWVTNHQYEERTRLEREAQQRESDRKAVEQLGGTEFAIRSFYASPGAIRRGETVQLCYDVANAKSVTLEPQNNAVWPSHSRCVPVSPARDTTYTLTITDAAGNIKTASLQVIVR